ncbi:MAG: hypothetical protein QXE80_08790 [Pyrobaculum sp.]
MPRKLKPSYSRRGIERFRLRTEFAKQRHKEKKKEMEKEDENQVVTLLYVLREALGLPISFLNEYLVNRRSKDILLRPKLQFRKYPDKDAFNIEHNVFGTIVLGFPLGYLHKPIPRKLADQILHDIDIHLCQRLIENKYKILKHLQRLRQHSLQTAVQTPPNIVTEPDEVSTTQ